MAEVSIIIPTYNEEKFIGKCLDSILSGNYPLDKIKILVVDGGSTDNTRKIVKEYEKMYPKIVKLLYNPYKFTPYALNIGIRQSKGNLIMFAGAHTFYSKDYLEKCVKAHEKGFDVTGGVVITLPRSNTPMAVAISNVLSHVFGVGKAIYRIHAENNNSTDVEEADTVAYGVYKKDLFRKYGYFNENLIRNQDIELNLRFRRNGARIGLVKSAKAYYYARDNLKDLWKNNFANGFWVIWSLQFAKLPFSLRHLVPLFFVLFLFGGFALSLLWPVFLVIYLPVLFLYFSLLTFFSANIGLKNCSFTIFICAMAAFVTLHISYGVGSLTAFFKLLFKKIGGKKKK